MQTHSTDLFPETLLVTREGERIYTTSRRVAQFFGKQHKDVLRTIKTMVPKLTEMRFNGRNFAPVNDPSEHYFVAAEYIDAKGEKRTEYHLTHDGFSLLTMGFTGDKALYWKVEFLRQFNEREAELVALKARYLAALDQIRPNLRPTVEAFEAGLPRIVTAQQLGKSVASISYHRSQARRFGLLPARQEVAA